MAASRSLLIPSSEPGVQLSARVAAAASTSTSVSTPRRGLLLLHAWPRLGGSSSDPVLTAIFHAARKSGDFAVVLRYDQRGVGGSGGGRAVWGAADAADAVAVAARMRDGTLGESIPAVDRLHIVGYSWGAALGALGALPLAAGWVGVSPPFGGVAGLALRTGRAAAALAARPGVPGLVLLGDRDQFASVRGVERVLAGINAQRQLAAAACKAGDGDRPAAVELQVVEGADHFWGGATAWSDAWGQVAAAVLDWVRGVERGKRS